MGMTIKDAKEYLINWDKAIESRGDSSLSDARTSLRVAIATMRKYQKIEDVMDNRADDSPKSNSKALSDIEVIIYGDND